MPFGAAKTSGFNNPPLNRVVVSGTGAGDGVFVYSGNPQLGNSPVEWITNGSLVDPYGNVLPGVAGSIGPGVTVFESLVTAGGAIQWFRGPSANGPWTAGAKIIGDITGNGELSLISGNAVPAEIDLINNKILIYSPTSNGNLTGISFTPGTGWTAQNNQVDESWHAMSLAAGFAAGAQAPRYRLMPDNTVRLRGGFTLTATQAANATFWTPPAGYVPSVNQFYAGPTNLSGYAAGAISVRVTTTTVQIGASGVSGNFVTLDGITYTLDP